MGYKDPDRQRQFQREWVAARRKAWLQANGPCWNCGSWDRLEVDHVDPARKVTHRVWSLSDERRRVELSKCQVLCHACHLQKTAAYYKARRQHGHEMKALAEKCLCPACNAYRDRKNERRRELRRLRQLGFLP